MNEREVIYYKLDRKMNIELTKKKLRSLDINYCKK